MSVVQCPCPTPPWLLVSSLALMWEDHWWPTGTCAKLCNASHIEKPPRTSSETLRNKLGWTTLHRRRQIAMVCQVHRCLQKQAPPYLCSKFITNSKFGYRGTRGANKLHLLRPNTNFYRNTFEFQGAQCYNNLPPSMRQISNRTTFRSALASTCWNEL